MGLHYWWGAYVRYYCIIMKIPIVLHALMPRAGSTERAAAGSLAAAGHSSSLLVLGLGGVRRAFTEGRPCYSPGPLRVTGSSLATRTASYYRGSALQLRSLAVRAVRGAASDGLGAASYSARCRPTSDGSDSTSVYGRRAGVAAAPGTRYAVSRLSPWLATPQCLGLR